MKHIKQESLFSIDFTKRKFYDENTQTQSIVENQDKHEFDLNNENLYNIDGVLIIEAKQDDYYRAFLNLIETNRFDIENILDYHYSKTNDVKSFINFIKLDLIDNSTIINGIRLIINEWLNKDKNSIVVYSINNKSENQLIKSETIVLDTIEDYLFEYKEEMVLDENNYNLLIHALKQFFDTGKFQTLENKIKVRKVNKKRFGWSLTSIFRALKTNNEKLSYEYLRFAKENISIFENTDFNEKDILKSNLYKYFTKKTL